MTALAALLSLGAASGAAEAAAPVTGAIIGEIERMTLNNPNDVWSGGIIVVGGQSIIVPRNLLADFPANRLTLQQTFAGAPAACVALGESGLAKADKCNTSGTGAIATIAANRTNGGNTIAGDVFFQKGIETVSGSVTFINHTDGYFRLNGNANDPTTGIMVRLNDPISRHTVQQGLGCAAGAPNCSPDPRFTLDPDNYTNVFSSGYPYCLPSTVARRFVDVLDLNGNGNRTETLTAQGAANGTGDVLCPAANRNLANLADDSRRFAPLQVGDAITVDGNFETINGVRFLSAHSSKIQGAIATKDLPDQPDYMFIDEMFVDAPGFQNQRVRTLFIGFTTLPSDVLIWSTHHDPTTNQLHELPLATTRGCDNAAGPSSCSNVGLAAGAGGNIFRIRHDVDFNTGALPKLNPCAHLRADPRFAATNPCPQGGTLAEQFAVLSPIPHEVQGRTGHKVADLERAGGPILVSIDINGQDAKNGQYLFPMGIGLGGIDIPNGFEINLNIVNMPFFFSGIPWNLDRRLSPGGCVGACEATPQPLDPFPFEGGDPRTQANLPTGPYNDPTFSGGRLTSVRDRVLSFVDGTLGRFNGDRTVLAWPPPDPPARPILPVPPLVPADTTPPSPPTRVAAFAVSTSQIVVTWGGATDNVGVVGYRLFRDGGVAPIATITNETSFLDGGLAAGTTHSYTVVALDAANNASAPSAAASATTTGAPAPDRTPPVLTLPANITVTATGPTGAVVTYTATANDAVSGPVTPACIPASGATFPVGTTTVTCSATDAAGNTATGSFTVTVNPAAPPPDRTPPVLSLPGNITVTATGPTGAVVTYTATANDAVSGPVTPTCTPASGSTFPVGTRTVTCTATDAAGNTATGSFTVTVNPAPPPAAGVVLFGSQTVQDNVDSNDTGMAEAFQYTSSQSGTVTKLSVYLDSTSTASRVVVGLYADDGADNPAALLTQAAITAPTAGAFNEVAVPSAAVTAGQRYWIAVLAPSGATGKIAFRDVAAGGGLAKTSAQTTLTALPAAWATGSTFDNSPMSAFAQGTQP